MRRRAAKAVVGPVEAEAAEDPVVVVAAVRVGPAEAVVAVPAEAVVVVAVVLARAAAVAWALVVVAEAATSVSYGPFAEAL